MKNNLNIISCTWLVIFSLGIFGVNVCMGQNSSNILVIEPKFENISVDDNLIIFGIRKNGEMNYGLFDKAGKEILAATYKDIIRPFKNGFAVVINNNGLYGLIDKNGNIVFDTKYSRIDPILESANYWAYNDKMGYVLLNPYTQNELNIKQFLSQKGIRSSDLNISCGFVKFTDNNTHKFGAVNSNGELIAAKHDEINCDNGFVFMRVGGNYKLYDKKGKELICNWIIEGTHPRNFWISPIYQQNSSTNQSGYYIVTFASSGKQKKFIIDKQGKKVFSDVEREYYYNDGYLAVKYKINDGYFYKFLNKEGTVTQSGLFSSMGKFDQNCVIVSNYNGSGLINTSGKQITPLKYHKIYPFKNGLAKVQIFTSLGFKYGFIDKTGKEIISPKYLEARDFSDGLVIVKDSTKKIILDKSGTIISKPDFEYIDDFKYGLARIIKDNKCGFIDKNCNVVIPCVYDQAMSFDNNFAEVVLGNKKTLIDKFGKEIKTINYNEEFINVGNGIYLYSSDNKKLYGLIMSK